jgi:hypothetical protein
MQRKTRAFSLPALFDGVNSVPDVDELKAAAGWYATNPVVGLMCEQTTGIGMPTSPVVQSDIIADVGGVAVAVQHVDVTQQVEAEFFDCCVEQTTDDDEQAFVAVCSSHDEQAAGAAAALGPGFGLFTIPAVDAEVFLLPAGRDVAEGLDIFAEVGNIDPRGRRREV